MTDEEPREPSMTITEAAQAAGVARSTVRRRLDLEEFPRAWREPEPPQRWRVPVADLLAAGLDVHRPSRQDSEPDPEPPRLPETARLAAELELERARRQAAEALAQERLDRIEDLRASMRQLEAGPRRRRGWLGRLLEGD